MTEPAPSPRVFYKYTSAWVAKIVLATRCLRYSSPLLFNDPFDVTQELRLNFDERGLYAALSERVAWLMEQGDATLVRHPSSAPCFASRWPQALTFDAPWRGSSGSRPARRLPARPRR